MAGSVFISHSSRDVETARGICESIEKRGVACWISGRDVDVGEHYGDAIVEAIERAAAMVLVFSHNANHSEEIKKEVALASKLGVAVFPVRIENIEPTGAFRYELMTRQWIDLFAGRDEGIKKLTEKIVALPAKAKLEGEAPPASKPAPMPPPPALPARRLAPLIGAAAVIIGLFAASAAFWAHSGASGDPGRGQALAGGTSPSPQGAAPAPSPPIAAASIAPPALATPASVAQAAAQPAPKPIETVATPVSPVAGSVIAAPSSAPPPAAPGPPAKTAEVSATPVSTPPTIVAALEAPKAQPEVVPRAPADTAPSPAAALPQPAPARAVVAEPAAAPAQRETAPSVIRPETPAPRPVLVASLASVIADAGAGDDASAPAALVAPPAPGPKLAPEAPRAAEAEAAAKPLVGPRVAGPASSDPPQPATPAPAPASAAPVVDPSPARASAAPPAPTKPVVVAALATTAQPDKRPPADAAVKTFKDCAECPEMVVAPAGSALIGSPPQEAARMPNEAAPSEAVIPAPFAIGRYDVTFDEWESCVAAGGCNNWLPGDFGWGRGRQPVIFVSWNDAHAYVAWLSAKTGKPYRLLSETEWEYAARACTTTACPNKPFWFGSIKPEIANYDARYAYEGSPKGQSRRRAVAADEGPPNPFGLFNMLGNVRQWVEDCWSANPGPPPAGGAPRLGGDCSERVTRGGSYDDKPQELRAAARSWQTAETRSQKIGFRVARALDP